MKYRHTHSQTHLYPLKTPTLTLPQRQLVHNFADGTMCVDIEKY